MSLYRYGENFLRVFMRGRQNGSQRNSRKIIALTAACNVNFRHFAVDFRFSLCYPPSPKREYFSRKIEIFQNGNRKAAPGFTKALGKMRQKRSLQNNGTRLVSGSVSPKRIQRRSCRQEFFRVERKVPAKIDCRR